MAFCYFTGGTLLAKASAQPHAVWVFGLWTFTAPNRAGWMERPRRSMIGIAAVSASLMTRKCAVETATLVDGSTPPGLRCEKCF